jgi:hypothetical protein
LQIKPIVHFDLRKKQDLLFASYFIAFPETMTCIFFSFLDGDQGVAARRDDRVEQLNQMSLGNVGLETKTKSFL